MSRKIFALPLSAMLFALAVSAEAPPAGKIPRIGFLAGSRAPFQEGFRQGLHELGYIEGRSIVVEYRYGEGKLDRLDDLAADLVRLKPDVIVTAGTLATTAVKRLTSTIPIVVASAGDLVKDGLVASLARPGGNVTGLTRVDPDFSAKRLDILKEAFPKLSHVAILHAGTSGDQEELTETRAAAPALGIQIQSVQVQDSGEFQSAYRAMSKGRAEALIILYGSFTLLHRRQLLELANKNRLPTMCGQAIWADNGGVIAYGPDPLAQFRRAAVYVDKILKGTKPADLPVEQPTKFELVINLKAAKQIGLTIPPNVLVRADRVIK
jgi:ABC-type uncharacterized transport system substrate-binding protein